MSDVYEDKDSIQVHPLHFKFDQRRPYTVIVSDDGEGWLVPTNKVPGNFSFTLTLSELDELPKPYDFSEIIEAVMPTAEELKLALWSRGIVTKDDLGNVAEINRIFLSMLPVAKSLTKFAVGE